MKKPLCVLCCVFALLVMLQVGYAKQIRPPLSRDPFNPPSSVIKSQKIKKADKIIVHGIVTVCQQRAVVITIKDETETLCQGQTSNGYLVRSIEQDGVILENSKGRKKYSID